MEQVILISAQLKNDPYAVDTVEELRRLSQTAGAQVRKVFYVRLQNYNAATLIGSGKIAEIAKTVEEMETDTVIFDEEITPVQQKNLEEAIPAKVLDRTRLILDIFAKRARTQEGKLQVELAQLNYLLPRLSGKGTAMMQQKGGIGMRGPGERKLEYDRRRLRLRISKLEKEIDLVKTERTLRRKRRGEVPLPQIAIAGYTNAGKSTLLNTMTQAAAVYADDKLFATLDPTTRRVSMPSGGEMLFTDTVGFIQKLPHTLVSAFRATLEEITFADLILHVQDSTSPQREAQSQTVRAILKELDAKDIPLIEVFNKAELLTDAQLRGLKAAHPEAVFISAFEGINIDGLLERVERKIRYKWKTYQLEIPASKLGLLGIIYKKSIVTGRYVNQNGNTMLTVMATEGNYNSLSKLLNAA